MTQPAGSKATLEYTFRNGERVDFTAHRIDVEGLLEDVKSYIRANPRQLDWQKINVADIGMRLVQQGEKKYVGKKINLTELSLKLERALAQRRLEAENLSLR